MIGCGVATRGIAAAVVGGDRFALWVGRSGRRHVFSRLEGSVDADDLAGAVVLITGPGEDRSILWVGSGAEVPPEWSATGRAIHAHWLAETAAERAAVIADLGGRPVAERRLAGARVVAAAA